LLAKEIEIDQFIYYRGIRTDGNSYYRAVMYSYLELLIMTRKTQSLEDLVKWINSANTLYSLHLEDFDKDYRVILTRHLLEVIEAIKRMENNAVLYCLVQKMFLLSEDFDIACIIFAKNVIRNFIINHQESTLNGKKVIDMLMLERGKSELNDYLD
jgi:hypothetical protein